MSESWANSSVDLLVELRGNRRRSGLESALREAANSGRLPAGELLPSSRVLAAELGLSRNTVADAYGQLVAEGWLTARQGSGTRVADRAAIAAAPASPVARARVARREYDLTPGTPDLSGFPRGAWLAASRRAMVGAPAADFGYPDPRGLGSLRETLARYLARVRGVRTTADRIVICSGFQQALHLLATTLRQQGARTLGIESYGIDLHRDVIAAAGLDIRPLPVDASGAEVQQLAHENTAGVLLTPVHQFPLGVALTPDRRTMVLEWARDTGGLVIEDDYDGEFRYDRKPIGALQSLAPDSVAYVGTASKSLVPGLGLAWLVVPPGLIESVTETKRLSDGYTGVFEQLALDELIRAGSYDRHVRRSRATYRRRRDRLVHVLATSSPSVKISGIAAGLHAVVQVGGKLRAADEPALTSRAARAGLTIQGLNHYRCNPVADSPAALVVGYGTPPEHSYAGALEALCAVLPDG